PCMASLPMHGVSTHAWRLYRINATCNDNNSVSLIYVAGMVCLKRQIIIRKDGWYLKIMS
ncbi:MAG: hypothetical protein ABI863_09780, partial [Ginsengibacter sp.]